MQDTFLEPFFQSRLGRIVSNFILQGMLYMNPYEVFIKLVVDFILIITFYMFFEPQGMIGVLTIIVMSHGINWLINCQPVALLYHMDIGQGNPRKFINYIDGLYARINKYGLPAAAAYGSLSRYRYNNRSDIDIRLIVGNSLVEKIYGSIVCLYERARAFLFWFPLDIYMFTVDEVVKKMNTDEPPILFKDIKGVLRDKYDETIPFKQFADEFRKRYVGDSV